MKADVAIITALPKELDAVLRHGERHHGLSWTKVSASGSIRTYHVAHNKSGTRIAAVQATGMGQLRAAIVTSDVINDCSPQVILLVGIAASADNNVNLGDVAISDQLIDYEPGKLTDEGNTPHFPVYKSTPALLAKLKSFREQDWKVKIISERPDAQHNITPSVYFGDIFCGNKVVADSQTIRRLKVTFPKSIALEMESVGIASMLAEKIAPPHFAMVKGICDRADTEKDDRWQEFAADVAAAYTLAFLETYDLVFGSREIQTKSHFEIDEQTNKIIDFVAPDLHGVQVYQHDLVRQVVKSSLKEVNDILTNQYSTDLGHGRQFLLRAAPLFGNASNIYATSLDTVSTFWTDRSNRAETMEYLRHQAPNGTAMRLFVFSNADSAHRYAKMLDLHAASYHNVFICSKQKYRRILDEITIDRSIVQLSDRDFAVLQYKTIGTSVMTSLYAELGARSLEYKRIDIEKPGAINYTRYLELFKRFALVAPGQSEKSYEVLRWQQGMWQDKESWAETLRRMFNERTSDVFHMVFFHVDAKTERLLRERCAEIKRTIMNCDPDDNQAMKNKYGIKDVWFGKKMKYKFTPHDGYYKGRLALGNRTADPYVLIMQFDTEEGLMRFYGDEEHSTIRKRVYETLDSRIQIMYESTENGTFVQDDEKAIAYEFIEAMAEHYMTRQDYIDDEMIREMVMTSEPYQF